MTTTAAECRIPAHKIAEAREVPIADELGRRGIELRRVRKELVGPCPVCGGTDRFAVNLAKQFGTVGIASVAAMPSHWCNISIVAASRKPWSGSPGMPGHQHGNQSRGRSPNTRPKRAAPTTTRSLASEARSESGVKPVILRARSLCDTSRLAVSNCRLESMRCFAFTHRALSALVFGIRVWWRCFAMPSQMNRAQFTEQR
jgi:hypothetical protein